MKCCQPGNGTVHLPDRPPEFSHAPDWICPDLRLYWKLGKVPNQDLYVLVAVDGSLRFPFPSPEACCLKYFTGKFTVSQIQKNCERELGAEIPPDWVQQVIDKLMVLGILSDGETEAETGTSPGGIPPLKAAVEWIEHPDGYWILRNREDLTYLQVDDRSKAIIQSFGQLSPPEIMQIHGVSGEELRSLLQYLAATAMLEGTKPPKPPKRKFTPLQLLSFKIRLFNPDAFLNNTVDYLRWIWTKPFAFILTFLLTLSAVIGWNQKIEILLKGQELLALHGTGLLIPFILLVTAVVTLHELGHAYTLKHYGGIVPEVGLFFMCLMPSAYINTSDSYCLTQKRQRTLVVAAGVIMQLVMGAIALGLLNASSPGSGLYNFSLILLVAALFTVTLNLNPLAKFDGYYLAVSLTGINNLRSRAFSLYWNLIRLKPLEETPKDSLILALYAPFSIFYVISVFGFLLYRILDWSLLNIPHLALTLLVIWLIYFYSPNQKPQPSK